MPAFLTHWRILIETARHSQDAGSDLGSLIIDATALRRRAHGWSTPPQTTPAGAVWDTGPLPEIDFHFPGSDISSMAFLGALAPDILYYHRRHFPRELIGRYTRKTPAGTVSARPPRWSDLFHTSHSGDLLILFLEEVALVPSPALRSQALAFALGYVSHIAADIALNPWLSSLAARLLRQRKTAHFLLEQSLDEYLSASYFEHPRYSLFYQPWGEYVEPAARSLSQPASLSAQMLHLLASAAQVYGLDEAYTETLPRDFLQGLQGLRLVLAGRGRARWLRLLANQKELQELISKMLAVQAPIDEVATLEQALAYATRLSEHLCRRAINYYTALRNPNAEASERASRRAELRNDLRNWNLYTGYTTDEEANESANGQLFQGEHFADLWQQEMQGQADLSGHMQPTS